MVDAERTALQSERLATQIQGQRLVTSVFLIKALGGGWTSDEQTKQTASLVQVSAPAGGDMP